MRPETKDIGNNSETIETTDTTRNTDDQKTNPNKDGNRQLTFTNNNRIKIKFKECETTGNLLFFSILQRKMKTMQTMVVERLPM